MNRRAPEVHLKQAVERFGRAFELWRELVGQVTKPHALALRFARLSSSDVANETQGVASLVVERKRYFERRTVGAQSGPSISAFRLGERQPDSSEKRTRNS